MNTIKLLVPLKLANLGVSLKRVDKSSLLEALIEYHGDTPDSDTDPLEALAEKPLDEQFVVTSVDPINEVVEVILSQELYHELCNRGAVGGLSIAYGCDLSPLVTVAFWKVSKVHTEILSVTVEVPMKDYLMDADTSEQSEEESLCHE